MSILSLKTYPEYFQAIWEGKKTFEWREHISKSLEGEIIFLKEFDPQQGFTHRIIEAKIPYILTKAPGMPEGYSILSLKEIVRYDIGCGGLIQEIYNDSDKYPQNFVEEFVDFKYFDPIWEERQTFFWTQRRNLGSSLFKLIEVHENHPTDRVLFCKMPYSISGVFGIPDDREIFSISKIIKHCNIKLT